MSCCTFEALQVEESTKNTLHIYEQSYQFNVKKLVAAIRESLTAKYVQKMDNSAKMASSIKVRPLKYHTFNALYVDICSENELLLLYSKVFWLSPRKFRTRILEPNDDYEYFSVIKCFAGHGS